MLQRNFVESAFIVERLRYFADRPRKPPGTEEAPTSNVTEQLYDLLNAARQSVVIQSPYMVLSEHARSLFRDQYMDWVRDGFTVRAWPMYLV